jgi:hypothetical protein
VRAERCLSAERSSVFESFVRPVTLRWQVIRSYKHYNTPRYTCLRSILFGYADLESLKIAFHLAGSCFLAGIFEKAVHCNFLPTRKPLMCSFLSGPSSMSLVYCFYRTTSTLCVNRDSTVYVVCRMSSDHLFVPSRSFRAGRRINFGFCTLMP